MARENPLFSLTGLTAAADLSANQYYGVKITGENQVNVADTDGEPIDGVLQDDPGSGESANVMAAGITKIVASEALAAGDYWGVASDGRAKKVEATNTGADVGDFIAGRVLEAASGAGALATVTVGLLNYRVESV